MAEFSGRRCTLPDQSFATFCGLMDAGKELVQYVFRAYSCSVFCDVAVGLHQGPEEAGREAAEAEREGAPHESGRSAR